MLFKRSLKHNGSALLSSLFMMTLVAIAATAMSTRLQLDIYRTKLSIQSDKLYLASQAVGFWAMDRLLTLKTGLVLKDEWGRVLDYPKSLQTIYPQLKIEGHLYDLQARFNLNNLKNKSLQPLFLRLLTNNLANTEFKTLTYIVSAVENWVSHYRPESGQDQWLTYYSAQKPPYLPGYQPMQSVSEFRTVAGVTARIYQTMLPMITALPTQTPININTASKALLMILGGGLTESQVETLLELRREKGLFVEKDLLLVEEKFKIPVDQISVQSEYYLSVASVQTSDIALKCYTVIRRTKERTGNISVHMISETLNAY